jgi:pimeloyl-ACP methyl ester carboxylesterase
MKLLITLLLTSAAAFSAVPCMKATEACQDWVTLGGGPWRSRIYTTYPLATRNPQITRAFIMVHGTNRDADNYFRTALAAAFLGDALEDTIVISPRIASAQGGCHDQLTENEVSWSCGGDSWRSGGTSASTDKLTSFDFVDELLRKLAKRDAFPNLKTIVVAGHSAGGQFVNRYSMANRIHETLGLPVTYVVANPSSYAYLVSERPVPVPAPVTASRTQNASKAPATTSEKLLAEAEAAASVAFTPFAGAEKCANYDRWPYGMQNRTGGYTANMSVDQLKKQLVSRPVTYLLGEIDILPLGGFDGSCSAMAQGPTRLARGQAFAKFVTEKLGAQHKMQEVHLCGHNARCMFTDEATLPLIFPKQ